jgi:hypothetical protein
MFFGSCHDSNDNRPLSEKAEKQVLNRQELHVLQPCSLSKCYVSLGQKGFEKQFVF